MNILALNPGSATLKFGLYRISGHGTASAGEASTNLIETGTIEHVGATTGGQPVEEIVQRLNAGKTTTIEAVGCRVVHGGARLAKPTLVTPAVLDELRELKELAPLHVPADIAILEQVRRSLPGIPLVAVFDTAFHRTLPEVAHRYALPAGITDRFGLRRYGFHGISHSYVSRVLMERMARGAKGSKLVICHLGGGASVCAVRDGESIDTSMGFTPMEGLAMSTRAGDIDPGLVLYLIRAAGMTSGEVNDLLNNESGLLGLSGLSGDVRDLELAAGESNRAAELALEIFAYRACKYIGAYAAALEGIDALAFSGGIGEHSVSMRERICRRLGFLGLRLDKARNNATDGSDCLISAEGSAVEIWVIPTDEDGEIARSTYDCMHVA